jgi:protein involved in polysaccharide export with SLBB domain
MKPLNCARRCLLAALLLVSFHAFPVHAAAAGADPYVLGPNDVIEITDVNHEDMNMTLTVLSDGTVTYPWAGRLRADGKTPAELAAEIQAVLEKTRNNVAVTVGVKEARSRRVRVAGAVKNPGSFDLQPNWRALDLIPVAGGLTTRAARVRARLIRGGRTMTFDLAEALRSPDSDANPVLERDDLVLLDELDPASDRVFVVGQVNRPGAYDPGDAGINIMSLLAQAGNTTDQAALTQAHVLRGATDIPVNLYPTIVEGKVDDSVRSFSLQAGDVLFVPLIEKRVAVMGGVNHPGYYPIPETRRLTVIDALSLAGGQAPGSDLSKAGIIRTVNGAATVLPVDLNKLLSKPGAETNIVLQSDDILFVPALGKRKFSWGDILTPISALSYLGFRVFR